MFAWVDFGGVREPSKAPQKLDLCMLPRHRILYQAPDDPFSSKHRAAQQMLASWAIYIYGSMWIAPAGAIDSYVAAYEDQIRKWHQVGVSDDDQNLIYQLAHAHPELFSFMIFSEEPGGGWFSLFSDWKRKRNCISCDSICGGVELR